MELSEQDKDRIKAEERARFEARRELMHEKWGGWGGGCCGGHGWHRFGFLKGLVVGIILCWLLGLCRMHMPWGCYGPGMMGQGCYGMGAPMTPPPPGPQPAPKK